MVISKVELGKKGQFMQTGRHSVPNNGSLLRRQLKPLVQPTKAKPTSGHRDQEEVLQFEFDDPELQNSNSQVNPPSEETLKPSHKKVENFKPSKFILRPHSLDTIEHPILGGVGGKKHREKFRIPPRCGLTFTKEELVPTSKPISAQPSGLAKALEQQKQTQLEEQLEQQKQTQLEEQQKQTQLEEQLEQQNVTATKETIKTNANSAIETQNKTLEAHLSSCRWWSLCILTIPFTLYSYYSKKSEVNKNIENINKFKASVISTIESCRIKTKNHLDKLSTVSQKLLATPELLAHGSNKIEFILSANEFAGLT